MMRVVDPSVKFVVEIQMARAKYVYGIVMAVAKYILK